MASSFIVGDRERLPQDRVKVASGGSKPPSVHFRGVIISRRMLPFDDERWHELNGGYRMRFDPRPFLADIDSGKNTESAWHELWEELHHQGDVGEASYAAVPHLARMCRERGGTTWSGWNVCSLVAIIDLARREAHNPPLPEWCRDAYLAAIQDLAVLASADMPSVSDADVTRALLSVIALSKELPRHAKILINCSEEEVGDLEWNAPE